MDKILLVIGVALVPYVLGAYNSGLPGANFPVTQDLLECAEDSGVPKRIPLQYTRPGEAYIPVKSQYPSPIALDSNRPSLGLIPNTNLLMIDETLQQVSRPTDFDNVLYLPMRYDLTSQDYRTLQNICGEDVLANVTDGNSTRNADQGTWGDITTRFNESWFELIEQVNVTDLPEPTLLITQQNWNSEHYGIYFIRMIRALECRVAFQWVDAGPTFFPRYFRQGFCLNRKCSMPDRDEFRCHADLSPEESGVLETARWDCCWTYDKRLNTYDFECGWRRVEIPIVCDCDCRCPHEIGI